MSRAASGRRSLRAAPQNLREVQKAFTRALMRDCARDLFYKKGYGATTIDQIVTAAGASRQTFYLHFSDKEDVLREIVADYRPRALAQMERLAGPSPSLETVRDWVGDVAAFVVREKASVVIASEIGATATVLPNYIRETVEAFIETLGRNLPSFAAARAANALGLEARARAGLAIASLFWAAQLASQHAGKPYGDIVLRVAAEAIHGFIHDRRFAGPAR